MPSYRIADGSRVRVRARSSIHDTDTVWSGVTGTIDADRANLAATKASIDVDMTSADAGDFLKNRKLRKDLDLSSHPRAGFLLNELAGLREEAGRFHATVRGSLSWRGKSIEIEAQGSGNITDDTIDAVGSFDLDVTRLGVTPPRFLMFKVEEVVTVEVQLKARRS